MVSILNLSGGQLVCSLKSGDTLRIDSNATESVKEGEMTGYLLHLEEIGLVKISKVVEKKTNTKEISNEEREGK